MFKGHKITALETLSFKPTKHLNIYFGLELRRGLYRDEQKPGTRQKTVSTTEIIQGKA